MPRIHAALKAFYLSSNACLRTESLKVRLHFQNKMSNQNQMACSTKVNQSFIKALSIKDNGQFKAPQIPSYSCSLLLSPPPFESISKAAKSLRNNDEERELKSDGIL